MSILVTGAAGFIGNALVRRLALEGHQVRALIHRHPSGPLPSTVTSVVADITDPSSLSSVVHNVDVIFHCAALVKDFGSKKQIMEVNVQGTQNLVHACEDHIKRFIYLGHMPYDSQKNRGDYSISKSTAEQYLLDKYHHDQFPVIIIRPGNVYGPGATTWVLRPLQAIQRNRIALIESGQGIFLHTYIDNLIDALLTAMQVPNLEGEIIDVTDGDNTTTWGEYLNALAAIAGKKPIKKTMSKRTALFISNIMLASYYLFRIAPLVTPTAVHIFTNTRKVSLQKAEQLLKYTPAIDYQVGMKQVQQWLEKEQYV